MTAPPQIQQLVARFQHNLADYKRGQYNETQVRREFIDPLFKALGWDVDNTKGYAEAYKEVVHKDAIKVGRATKAPDYSFRIGGVRKFFLEAKKPSTNNWPRPKPPRPKPCSNAKSTPPTGKLTIWFTSCTALRMKK